jgi:hypothetical protein
MKTRWLFTACACLGLLSCGRNPAGNASHGADLSAQDRTDITLLASHFSERNIDSIWAGPTTYGWWVGPMNRENDFTGHVTFDSAYTDTDKISYQSLVFYNRSWYAYSAYGLPDSEMVFVNDWYSSLAYFSTAVKTVFKIDTLTIIATVSEDLNKTAIVGYLNTIYAIQADTADTNYKKIPAGFSLAGVTSINLSTYQDTTRLIMQCVNNHAYYWFRFFAGDFIDAGFLLPPIVRTASR